jgi:molybdenum cofactor biosynthesis enzyme MoaA
LQWRLLEEVVRRVREETDRGTVNLNTNGSLPNRVEQLCEAGLDSIRVTLSSPTLEYFRRYHRPRRYTFGHVVDSIRRAVGKGVYTSLNLLVLPGFTDREEEVENLIHLIGTTRFQLIQMRNLNIDPDLYLREMGGGEGMGIARMIDRLREEFPTLQFGYFNRTREHFFSP